MYNSPNNRVICNYSDNLNEAFYFNGPACDHTEFRQNRMSNNLTGLYLSPGSVIGPQFELQNEWEGTLPANGIAEAHFDGNPSQPLKFASQFSINDLDQNSDLWANPRDPVADWYVPSGGQGHNLLCYAELPTYPGISAANDLAIGGNFQGYKGYEASAWEAKLDAFVVLDADPNLHPADSPEAQFYASHENGNVGKLHRAREAWNSIARFSATFEAGWTAHETTVANKLDEIAEQNLLMEGASTLSEQEQIAQNLATLTGELKTLQNENAVLCTDYRSAVTTRAHQLDNDLDNLVTTNTWEQNLKTVLSLSVDRLLSGEPEWTTSQYATLESIANQCRHEGGIGVVLARSAIEKYICNDDVMCPGAGVTRDNPATVLKVLTTPNPANQRCLINFERAINGVAGVRNAQGQVIYETNLSDASILDLNVSDWPDGFYLFEARSTEGQKFSDKLIVVH